MGVVFIYITKTKNLVLGKFLIQPVLKHIAELDFGLSNDTFVKFYLRLAFAVVCHCLFAGLMEDIHRKFTELINPGDHTVPPLTECLVFGIWCFDLART